jgi:hypothetical protein
MTRMVYTTLGWESDYTYRIPCQRVTQPGGDAVVLAFDLDNYVGRAVNKKEEVVMARREAEMAEEQREDAKSFFYPPEEEDMPQEIKDMEDRFQRVREQNRKIFGEPVFEHDSTTRGFVEQESGEEWEMLAEARPIEVDHKVDEDTIHNLLQEIIVNPPELPRESVFVSEATVEGIGGHSNGGEQ